MKKKIWFTLVEVLITIVIMWFLIWLIFQVFVTIWRIAVFVQLNRTVHAEMMYVVQTMQNMVDDQYMNLTWLDLALTWWDATTWWWKSTLQLSDENLRYYLNNNCIEKDNCFLELSWESFLWWWLSSTWSVELTNEELIAVNSFAVRTLPYTSPSSYTWLIHDWFRLFAELRVPQYDETKWWLRVKQQLQLFFTMRKYE
jgi:prepilin-type N-terminal cleavage/methylation domain-containing protein